MNEQIKKSVLRADRILVVTHIGPDGDAIGSLTAVGQALCQMGKTADLVCDDGVPERFAYLSLANTVKTRPSTKPYDLLIAVDCGDRQRMGNAFETLTPPVPVIVNIDHHVTNTNFGTINLVEPTATSTTEILFSLFRDIGVELDADIALSLLTGLVTDTLGFRTSGVTSNTLKVASHLIDAGANLSFVTMQALNIKPLTTVQLWRIGLANMKLKDGFIWTSISREEQNQIGFEGAGTNGLVNILADIDIAEAGAALLEMPDGSVRVGWRCRPPFNVSDVATALGGGGHPLASGCSLPGPLHEAEARVVEATLAALAVQKLQTAV